MRWFANSIYGTVFESGLLEPVALRFTFICCYPFLITSILVLIKSGTALVLSRLLAAGLFNCAFFLTMGYLLRHFRPRYSTWLQQALSMFLTAFTFFSLMHFWIYAQLPGLPSIYAAIDTTPPESFEFLRSTVGFGQVIAAFALSAPIPWWSVRLPDLPDSVAPGYRMTAMISAAAFLTGMALAGERRPYLYMNNPVLLVAYVVPEAILEKANLQRLYATIPPISAVTVNEAAQQPVTHVLVIGESATSRHMSLYGYFRQTTPRLDQLKADLEIARDVCSSRGLTIAQLKELLTFATREDPTPLYKAPNLVQLLSAAGFRTYWLSNQQMVGVWDNWSAVFSKPADTRIFMDRRGGFEGVSYDAKLLPVLRDALAEPAARKFIVVHLMGAHNAYDLRYPKEFEIFSGRPDAGGRTLPSGDWRMTRYNEYDNAILYNDYIMTEILKLIQATDRTTLTYVSDHGEALGETSDLIGHMEPPSLRQVCEVPLLFYLSPAIKSGLGPRYAALRRNLSVPLQTDELIHTLLDLYGVGHQSWRPERSLLNPSFSPGSRFCDQLAQ